MCLKYPEVIFVSWKLDSVSSNFILFTFLNQRFVVFIFERFIPFEQAFNCVLVYLVYVPNHLLEILWIPPLYGSTELFAAEFSGHLVIMGLSNE